MRQWPAISAVFFFFLEEGMKESLTGFYPLGWILTD